jgi:hypothetical protein
MNKIFYSYVEVYPSCTLLFAGRYFSRLAAVKAAMRKIEDFNIDAANPVVTTKPL